MQMKLIFVQTRFQTGVHCNSEIAPFIKRLSLMQRLVVTCIEIVKFTIGLKAIAK